jgi:hypothetical protein
MITLAFESTDYANAKRCAMVIGETTVRPMDGAVEHPRMDSLRVDE